MVREAKKEDLQEVLKLYLRVLVHFEILQYNSNRIN